MTMTESLNNSDLPIRDQRKTASNKSERFANIDLIRCIALYFIPSIHFFMHTGFYNLPVNSNLMYIMTVVRTMSMMCIPLFLLITGFLMSKKTFGRGNFKGLIRILSIFFIYKVFVFIYKAIVRNNVLGPIDFIIDLSSSSEYSWYVGIYIWLYTIIPLLNIIFKKCGEKWQKQALVLAAIGVIILPTYANYYHKSMPDVFVSLYPIAYYYIGAYIREYNTKDKKYQCLALFVLSLLLSSIINILVSYNKNLVFNAMNDWGGFENALTSTFLFLFLTKLNLGKAPAAVKSLLKIVANLSFGAYLSTWFFDDYFYVAFNAIISDVPAKMKYYIIAVPCIFIGALIVSAVINVFYFLLTHGCNFLYSKFKEYLLNYKNSNLSGNDEKLQIQKIGQDEKIESELNTRPSE